MKHLTEAHLSRCSWSSADRPAAARVDTATTATIRRLLQLEQRDRDLERLDGFPDVVYLRSVVAWRSGATE